VLVASCSGGGAVGGMLGGALVWWRVWHAGADAGGADAGGADAASGGGGGGAAAGEVMAVLTSTLPVMSRDVEGVYCTQAASVWHRGC
jgi:hypothetical protein